MRSIRTAVVTAAIAMLAAGCGAASEREERSSPSPSGADRRASASTTTTTNGEREASTQSTTFSEADTAAGGRGATDAPPTGSSPPPASAETSTDTFIAPAGDYRYVAEGWTERHSATGTERTPHHAEQVDHVAVETDAPATVTVLTTTDGDNVQELRYRAEAGVVYLTHLTTWPPDQPAPAGITVTPSPPLPVARLPYRTGESWAFAWHDESVGVSGTGMASVLRNETLETAEGPVNTTVLELRQRLAGSVSAELTTTAWVDPRNGFQWRQLIVSETNRPTGVTRSETTRTLVAIP